MQRKSFIVLAVCTLMAVNIIASAADAKVDPVGTWKWTYTGMNGQPREGVLHLKMEGDKLTGSVGQSTNNTPITDVVLKDGTISFQTVRQIGGSQVTQKYNGKISGNTIDGKIDFTRNGQAESRDWKAKREVAQPAN